MSRIWCQTSTTSTIFCCKQRQILIVDSSYSYFEIKKWKLRLQHFNIMNPIWIPGNWIFTTFSHLNTETFKMFLVEADQIRISSALTNSKWHNKVKNVFFIYQSRMCYNKWQPVLLAKQSQTNCNCVLWGFDFINIFFQLVHVTHKNREAMLDAQV